MEIGVDESYVKVTGDPDVIVGRKVPITGQEVTLLIGVLKRLGAHLVNQLPLGWLVQSSCP